METLLANKIKLEEFKFLIGFLDLSSIQEELQSYHIDTPVFYNNIDLYKYDFYLNFNVETITSYKNEKITIEDVSISDVELWNEEEKLKITDEMILELQKEVTNTIILFV